MNPTGGVVSKFWVEREGELRRLTDEGLSAAQIGKAMGVTKNAAMGKIHRLGLQLKNPPSGRGRPRNMEASRLIVPEHKAVPVLAASPPPAAPLDEPEPATIDGAPVTILNVTNRQCKWGHGHPSEPGFHLCGQRNGWPNSSYCAHHSARAWSGLGKKRRAA